MMKNNFEKIFLKDKYGKYNTIYNIWALLFGGFYLLYRKLYLLAGIVFVLYFILYIFKLYYLIIIINIILCFVFNKIYLNFIRNRINNYELIYMDTNLVKKACSKKNINSSIVVIFIVIILILLILSNINFNNRRVIVGDISFKIDRNWEKGNYNNKYYSVYNYDNSCSFTVEIIGYYNDNDYLDGILDSYNSDSEIKNVKINNIDYKMINIGNNYIYTTYVGNDLYVLLFDIYNEIDLCYNYKNSILDSIVIKK